MRTRGRLTSISPRKRIESRACTNAYTSTSHPTKSVAIIMCERAAFPRCLQQQSSSKHSRKRYNNLCRFQFSISRWLHLLLRQDFAKFQPSTVSQQLSNRLHSMFCLQLMRPYSSQFRLAVTLLGRTTSPTKTSI